MDPFPTSLSDTERDILEATYRTFADRGYADTSMRHIAEEFGGSPSLLYYHYDDRAGLVADFLDHLLDALADRLDVTEATPRETLGRRLDRLLPPDPDPEATEFNRVVLELRIGAARQAAVADRFARNDELVRTALAEPIERGVEADLFRDVDPDATAAFLQSTALGATVRAVTLADAEPFRRTRWAAEAYVDCYLRR